MAKPLFFIPIENQVRELDAKLLLARFAADRGYRSILGWKGSIDAHINEFPQGVYFAKSLTARAVRMFRITRRLGHRIVAWDEEAVVHYPPNIYYPRRIDSKALSLTNQLLAWGDDNRSLFEDFPDYCGTPLDVVGNPRVDLLRPEFRDYFKSQVAALNERYGDFILVNTNFGSINGYYPELNVAYPKEGVPGGIELGRGAIGLPRDFALDLYHHRMKIFEAFQDLLPKLASAYPDRKIVLRPHPAENREFWKDRLKDCANVEVIAEGNVVPWLLACAALVHNGCTTAVESYILERPVVAYVPAENDAFSVDLPNQLSVCCDTAEGVIEQVGDALARGFENTLSAERSEVLGRYISSLDGQFASSRILDSIERDLEFDSVSAIDRLCAHAHARGRRFVKQMKATKSNGRYSRSFMRQRFPDVTLHDLRERGDRLAGFAGLTGSVQIDEVRPDVFSVSPA